MDEVSVAALPPRSLNPARSRSGINSRTFRGMTQAYRQTQARSTRNRLKLSDPAHETRGLQPERNGRVRCSAWLGVSGLMGLHGSGLVEKGNELAADVILDTCCAVVAIPVADNSAACPRIELRIVAKPAAK